MDKKLRALFQLVLPSFVFFNISLALFVGETSLTVPHHGTTSAHLDCAHPTADRNHNFHYLPAEAKHHQQKTTTTMDNSSSTKKETIENKVKLSLPPLVIAPNAGRTYPLGRITATFKADNDETNSAMSVSEWWFEPNTEGPSKHQNPHTHLIYVIEGPMAFYLQGKGWFEAEKGSYVYIPGNTEHGFENRSMTKKAGFMSIHTPGGFENDMRGIMKYAETKPFGEASNKS